MSVRRHLIYYSPSGHTSLSTLVYGGITLVTAGDTVGVRRIIAIRAGTGFISPLQHRASCFTPIARLKSV